MGCALLHIWLSIALMGCSNIVMGYPATSPLYILMAPPELCRGINGSCRSVAVTCFAPLIIFIYCCDASTMHSYLYPPATQVTCRGIKGQTVAPSPLILFFICRFVVVTTRRTNAKMPSIRLKCSRSDGAPPHHPNPSSLILSLQYQYNILTLFITNYEPISSHLLIKT